MFSFRKLLNDCSHKLALRSSQSKWIQGNKKWKMKLFSLLALTGFFSGVGATPVDACAGCTFLFSTCGRATRCDTFVNHFHGYGFYNVYSCYYPVGTCYTQTFL